MAQATHKDLITGSLPVLQDMMSHAFRAMGERAVLERPVGPLTVPDVHGMSDISHASSWMPLDTLLLLR
jgi:hypothetical protein